MAVMKGVRDREKDNDVELILVEQRLYVRAFNEGGHNSTMVDLLDIIEWVRKNRPELLGAKL